MNVMQLLLKKYKKRVNKVIKGGSILYILFVFTFSLVIPPFNIYAQSLTSPFLGVNVQVTQVDTEYNSLTLPKINIGYLSGTVPSGYISGQLNCTNPSTPTSSQPCDIYQFQNSSGTGGASNGTRVYLNLQQYYLEANGNASFNSSYNYIIDYEFVLDDNYKGYVTFNNGNADKTYYVNGSSFHYSIRQTGLTEIQFTIVDYQLSRVMSPYLWEIPFESLSFNIFNFNNNLSLYDIDMSENISYIINYPCFNVPQNTDIYKFFSTINGDRNRYRFVLIVADNVTPNNIDSYFSVYDGSISNIMTIHQFKISNKWWSVLKFDVSNMTKNSENYLRWINNNTQMIFIYANTSTNRYMSQTFAETYDLLDSLKATDRLENQKSSFDTTSNNLYTSENAFNTDMNNKLQNIDTSFNPSTSFGSKFLSSADWVRTQFNNLTSTSPFGTVLSFSMLLGLSLLIIGKVFK